MLVGVCVYVASSSRVRSGSRVAITCCGRSIVVVISCLCAALAIAEQWQWLASVSGMLLLFVMCRLCVSRTGGWVEAHHIAAHRHRMTETNGTQRRSGAYWATSRLLGNGLVLADSPSEIVAAIFPAYDLRASLTGRLTARLRTAVAVAELATRLGVQAVEAEGWVLEEQPVAIQRLLRASRSEPLPAAVKNWPSTQPMLVICAHLHPRGTPIPGGNAMVIDGSTIPSLMEALNRLGLLEFGAL